MFFVVVSGGGHFLDRPILPEVHDFSNLSLSSLGKFGFAALGPFSRGRSHIAIFSKQNTNNALIFAIPSSLTRR